MGGVEREAGVESGAQACEHARDGGERGCDRVEPEHRVGRLVAQTPRGRFHPGEGVVLKVLDRVDRIVAEGPEHAASVQQNGRYRQRAGRGHDQARSANAALAEHPEQPEGHDERADRSGRKPHQRAPVEREAQPRLRPPRDPLHERVGGHQPQRQHAQRPAQRRQRQQDHQRRQAAPQHERPGLLDADLPRGHRPQGGARHLGVDVAVDDVVVGAAGRPHQRRAQEEQQEQHRVGHAPLHRRRQGEALPPRQHQQPDPRRPIEPPQLQPRPQRRGRIGVHPVGGRGVGEGSRRRHSLPFMGRGRPAPAGRGGEVRVGVLRFGRIETSPPISASPRHPPREGEGKGRRRNAA